MGRWSDSELGRGWVLVLAACGGVVVSAIVLPYYSIGALLVPVTQEFGWTRGQFQAAILFSSGLGAVTAPVVGWLADRYGSRRVALPSLFGLALGFVVAASMPGELWVLYLAYAVMAVLGAGTIPVTWTRAITLNFAQQRGLALGLTLTGTGICAAVVPQYTVWLVEQYGWRVAYAGLAVLPVFVMGPLIWFGFRPKEGLQNSDADQPVQQSGFTLRQAAGQGRFWILLASIFVVYMAASGIGPNLIPNMTDSGFTAAQAASVQSTFGLAIVVGRVCVGYLVDRYWAPGVAALSMCLPVVGCMLLAVPDNLTISLVAAFLVGFAAGAELDVMAFLTARYFGVAHYAKIYAMMYMALAVCSGTAPMLFATVFDLTSSYAVSFYIAAGLFGLGAIIVLCMGKYPEQFATSGD